MKTSLNCIPCIIRQALDAAKLVSNDAVVRERILREALRMAARLDLAEPPPLMGQRIHHRIREITGIEDPYLAAKDRQNQMAIGLLPELRAIIAASPDPLGTAVRLAIAGNVIDMGVNGNVTESDVRVAIDNALAKPLLGDLDGFCRAVADAGHILYIADNAGEIAFDRLLIELLFPQRVTLAVRGAPVLNDALLADARAVGLDKIVEVIANGSDIPGTLLSACSPTFRRRVESADLIVAKGQGNFEMLSDVPSAIYFLYKAKCDVIAVESGVPLGAHVLARSRSGVAKAAVTI